MTNNDVFVVDDAFLNFVPDIHFLVEILPAHILHRLFNTHFHTWITLLKDYPCLLVFYLYSYDAS